MSRPLLIGDNPQVAAQLQQATSGQLSVVAPAEVRDSTDLARVMNAGASIVFIQVAGDPAIPLSMTSAITGYYATPTVLISDQAASISLAAMRAGARDILSPSATAGDYAAAIERALRSTARPDPDAKAGGQPGRVITVASAKGGVGKTTVATNLAVGLALLEPESTVIVDLDVQFGDVASALNLTAEYSLPDAARGATSGDALTLKTLLARHETGLYVVPGSDSPAESDTVTASAAAALIQLLSGSFHYVVIDTSPGLTDHTLAALDMTTDLVLVTSLDVPGVRGLRMELNTLAQLGVVTGTRHVVLNFNEPARGLSVADVEATINTTVDLALPPSITVPLSVNQGVPLLQSRGNDRVTKQLANLVERIAGRPQERARRGLFGRRG